jgi:ribosomal protein S12 methylthiotransferase accessory factor
MDWETLGDTPITKGYRMGTHRSLAPAQTLARVGPLLPALGITRVANITGLDRIGIPVVVACRPNSRSLAVAQGKGLDLAAAKASAVMEAIEAAHAERIRLPLKLGSYEELRYTHRLVEPDCLPRLHNSRYHPGVELLWIEGYDLLQEEPVWVPYELVHTRYTLPELPGSGCFFPSSNGLASGNHLLEAISHGICEVVERDATTLWYLLGEGEQQGTRLDLATVADAGCRAVLECYRRAGVAVAVWETTSEVGIPAFLCLIAEPTEDPSHAVHTGAGAGCHPSRAIALLRALTEAAQSRLTAIAGSRDDLFRVDYELSSNQDTLGGHRALFEPGPPTRTFQDVPTCEGASFNADVDWELERLRRAGIERVIVVDLTWPELRVPVARVVIPGLEALSTAPGYTPGQRARARRTGDSRSLVPGAT